MSRLGRKYYKERKQTFKATQRKYCRLTMVAHVVFLPGDWWTCSAFALHGDGFAFLVGGLAGAGRFLGIHFPSGMSLVKYNLFPKLCPIPHTPRALFTHEHHICPRGKHGCAVKFHFRESEQNVLGERPGTTASTGPLCRTEITHKSALTEDFQRSGGCNGSEQRGCIGVMTTRRARFLAPGM